MFLIKVLPLSPVHQTRGAAEPYSVKTNSHLQSPHAKLHAQNAADTGAHVHTAAANRYKLTHMYVNTQHAQT